MRKPIFLTALLFLGAVTGALAADAAPEAKDSGNPHGPLKDSCATCHGAEGWKPAKIDRSFDHGRFRFPLEGAHVQTACRACHLGLVFSEIGGSCDSCHQDAHRGELGNDCANCHTPRSFIDRARMGRAHQLTRFPLTGAHAGADCEACHVVRANRMYVNTPVDCVACHLTDYNATRDPNHVASGFAQTCQDCHNTVSFRPARFPNHDAAFFPISSGRHKGTWSACTDCHTAPGTYAAFSCFAGCHVHANPTEVAGHHSGVPGYTYDSAACYGCHPSP